MIAQTASRLASVTVALALLLYLSGCATNSDRHAGTARPVSPVRAADTGSQAVDVALRQVGVPYRFGGHSPGGFDCSGLVYYSYDRVGKSVPRTTGQLWHATTAIKRRDLRAGDLVFFAIDGKMQHVGMYVGDGRFVHAPSSGKSVSVASLSAPFYDAAFLRAGRLQ